MKVELEKKLQNVIIVEGFPGFGLVGTVASEYLIEHLKAEYIGHLWFDELPATIAVHAGKIIRPIEIHYAKKYNMVIVHSIASGQGMEWKISTLLNELAKTLKAKEIFSLEGVGSQEATEKPKVYFYSTDEKRGKMLTTAGVKSLDEGIVMGVTSAVLLKSPLPTTALFAETHTALPDSKAAAEIIKVLDKLFNLGIDIKPLIAMAAQFEEKVKGLIQQSEAAVDGAQRKKLSYVG